MTTIIRSDLTISGTYKLTANTQLAPGVKMTILPGATLDLGNFNLLNFGTLTLEGNSSSFAVMQNGTYSTDSTTGSLNSLFGNIKNLTVDSFFSNGSLTLASSLVQNSSIEALNANDFSNTIFLSSSLDFGSNSGTVKQVTFFDSPVSVRAWTYSPTTKLNISDSNFVGTSPLINLNPFFNGPEFSHSLKISGSYIRIPAGSNFEAMVYDSTDDLRVTKDLQASDFLTSPVTNSGTGFTVGTYTLSTDALLSGLVSISMPVATSLTNTLSVVVDKGVLGTDAVLLKELTEKMTLKDGLVTNHTVTYGATTFDYAQIDALIMTVTRNGNFTDEFKQEITNAAPSAASLTYTDAVALVGSANIDKTILHIAGADGLFVA
jgi:hypothetical protein